MKNMTYVTFPHESDTKMVKGPKGQTLGSLGATPKLGKVGHKGQNVRKQ